MNNQGILKQLEEIEARAEKATPGPWEWDEGVLIAADEREIMEWEPEYMQWKDMEFIAHSREDVPLLCQIVRKLLAVAEAAREALQWFEAFGYDWGIAVQDDFADHEPILKQLQATLAALEEVKE